MKERVRCKFCGEAVLDIGTLFVHMKNNHPEEWKLFQQSQQIKG